MKVCLWRQEFRRESAVELAELCAQRQWGTFTALLNNEIGQCHARLSHEEDATNIFRLQGEVKVLQRLLALHDEVAGALSGGKQRKSDDKE